VWEASTGARAGTWDVIAVPPDRRRTDDGPGAAAPVLTGAEIEAVVAAEAEWRSERDATLRRAARPGAVSATALQHGDRGATATIGPPVIAAAPEPDADAVADEDEDAAATTDDPSACVPSWRRGRGATAFGRAVHAVLQDVDLGTREGVGALAVTAAVAEGLPEGAADVAAAVERVLAAPVLVGAAGSVVAREMYVAAPVGDCVVEGYVDLLLRGPDGLVIVDYKTDLVEGATAIDARAAAYGLQLAAYASAIERATGEQVAGGVLVFGAVPGRAEPVERRFTRAELDPDRVERLLRAPA
jgi:ATP-dependent helicase/nuclease subunit A